MQNVGLAQVNLNISDPKSVWRTYELSVKSSKTMLSTWLNLLPGALHMYHMQPVRPQSFLGTLLCLIYMFVVRA